jgi:hypothetical protein
MRLDDFLRQLHETFEQARKGVVPAGEINNRLGIFDNWPILIGYNGPYNSLCKDLHTQTSCRVSSKGLIDEIVQKKDGKMELIVAKGVERLNTSSYGLHSGIPPHIEKHVMFQQSDYGYTLIICRSDIKVENHPFDKVVRDVSEIVLDLAPKLTRLTKSFCFPHFLSFRSPQYSDRDSEKIVYFPDTVADRMAEVE